MGRYEDEYKKYYLDAKAKLNIKSEIGTYKNKDTFKNEEMLNLNSSGDIYPKKKYNYKEENIYNYRDDNIYNEGEEKNNSEEKKSNYIIEDAALGTYKGIGSYSGINNYNNQNSYRGFYGDNGRICYGQAGGNNSNGTGEEKNILSKWGNRIIIELVLTVTLFASVVGIKSLPNKEAKIVYVALKEIVNTNFDYKNFMEEVRTIDVMKEVDKIKENLKVKPDDINTFKPKSNDENVDDITSDKVTDENVDDITSDEVKESTD